MDCFSFSLSPFHIIGQSRISRCSFAPLLTFHWLKQRTFLHFFCQGTKITANSATSRCLTGKQSWISRGSCFETSLSRCAIELHFVLRVSLCVCQHSRPLAWKSRVSGKISELYIYFARTKQTAHNHQYTNAWPNARTPNVASLVSALIASALTDFVAIFVYTALVRSISI